jgi:hypothetical protein
MSTKWTPEQRKRATDQANATLAIFDAFDNTQWAADAGTKAFVKQIRDKFADPNTSKAEMSKWYDYYEPIRAESERAWGALQQLEDAQLSRRAESQ